jgi:hypothetical protein
VVILWVKIKALVAALLEEHHQVEIMVVILEVAIVEEELIETLHQHLDLHLHQQEHLIL